jgi:ankyrin repeat protein
MKYIKLFEEDLSEEEKEYYNINLITAAQTGDIKELRNAINNGADIDYQGEDGSTALIIAAYYEYHNIVKYLVEHDADWSILDNEGLDFFDFLRPKTELGQRMADMYIKLYPKQYQEYLLKKDANKYNI